MVVYSAIRDENSVPVAIGVSSASATTVLPFKVSSVTGRLLTDSASGSGTVTDVSVATANGFAGSVATSTTTPVITISTTINAPVLAGNGTALAAATTTGSGSTVVLSNTPTLVTPVIGAATGTSLSVSGLLASATGLTLEETGAGTDIITIQAPASIASSYTLTLPVDDGNNLDVLSTDGSGVLSWVAQGSGANTALSNLASVSINTSLLAQTGVDLGSTTKPFRDLFLWGNGTFATTYLRLTGTPTSTRVLTIPDTTDTFAVLALSQALTNKSYNGMTLTATTGTFTLTNAKTLAVTNTLTLSGTDSTIMTFPTTSATIARTDAGNTFTGVSTGSAWVLTSPTITTKISPTSDDGAPLGDTTHNFSDLFLASGAVLNYANSNVVITHTSGILTMGTGELRITSANVGTNADSVPSLSSTSTLTNKTLTSPTIQTSPVLAAGTNIKFTLPADLTATGDITNEFNSGYSSTAIGDLVYLDASATWQKAKADSTTTSTNLLGIALSVAASGAAVTVLLRGFIQAATPFPTLTVGAPVYISGATGGAVVVTAPTTTDYVTRVVGHAVHADKMWFNPSGDWITHT